MSYVCKQPYIHTLTYEKCWIQECSRIVLQYWPSKFSHRLNFLTVNGWLEISKQRSNTGLWRSLQSLDSIPQRMWIDPTWSDHDTHTRTHMHTHTHIWLSMFHSKSLVWARLALEVDPTPHLQSRLQSEEASMSKHVPHIPSHLLKPYYSYFILLHMLYHTFWYTLLGTRWFKNVSAQ